VPAEPGIEARETLRQLREEALRWGLAAAGTPPVGLLYKRWLAGAPLWGEWLPGGAARPHLVSAKEAVGLADCELDQLISTLEEDAKNFVALPLPVGDEQHPAALICDLEVEAARRSQTPQYHLVLGAPGAGKSTLVGQVRPDTCQLDPDRLRAAHPWWCGGLGTHRVFHFTNMLRDLIFTRALRARASVVEEAVGANASKLVARISSAQDAGYEVAVTLVEATRPEMNRWRRERTAVTGRILHPASLSADPRETFGALQDMYPQMRHRDVQTLGGRCE
jgi:hypothetical protein